MSFDYCEHCGVLVESTLWLTPTWLVDRWGTWKEWLCLGCLLALRPSGRSPEVAAA